MSRYISTLLSADNSAVQSFLGQLEQASGEPSIDLSLTSEIITKTQAKVGELGLDPKDTSAKELYHSLLSLVALHDSFLRKRLGTEDATNIHDLIRPIKKTISKIVSNQTVWSLKHSSAKNLLKAHPPKELMNRLNYRSVDSMLKRERVDELYAGMAIVESSDWQSDFLSKYKKLKPSDFESRKPTVKYLDHKKWQDIAELHVSQTSHNIISIKELGAIVMLPLADKDINGLTLAMLAIALSNLNEISFYSSYFKYQQVQSNFGEIVAETLSTKPDSHINLAGQVIDWRVIHSYFNTFNVDDLDGFVPQLQANDLSITSVEESLYKTEPALHFWHQTNILGLSDNDEVVSLNLIDVCINYLNEFELSESCSEYLQESLWDTLLMRYMKEQPLHNQLVQQFEDNSDEGLTFADSLGAAFI